ncbi:MAG: ABC transporter permease [Chloroflexi bacterium]|nr:ABC transporter permease [Chloroflexota bacterium]
MAESKLLTTLSEAFQTRSPQPQRRGSRGVEFIKSVLRNRLAALGVLIVGMLFVSALLAPWLAPYDPEVQFSDDARQPPSLQYLFGTDTIGRDNFSRILYGTRVSLLVGVASMVLATTLGVTIGLVAGYYGGWLDALLMRTMDALLAFPAVLLAIFIIAVLGPSLLNAILAVGIVYMPSFARLIRASALSIREKEYLESARAVGLRDIQIMRRVILLNSLSPIVVQFSLGVGYAILVEAGLSFLGLGVQPPTPAWGSMLGYGRNYMSIAPWLTAFPGLAIFVTVLGFNFVGDGLREALDPRMRRI